ncbi:hypothetical protein SAMN05660860_00886 [Geoalkalibacter ferrihydriticus]|uniref:Uncharacterized protein n=1 Tax=Geoalkalibacter ferrihydriticus TaxID=392333 RepID=A0A1G9KWQ0_9BACT|nr:hypothetical protein SAMN05660860_00886 [Geoalkalibacter ferrihydriticus]
MKILILCREKSSLPRRRNFEPAFVSIETVRAMICVGIILHYGRYFRKNLIPSPLCLNGLNSCADA